MASLPLTVRGDVIGTLNLYASAPGFFDTEEMLPLDDLAMDIAFALELHERETERQRIDQALRDSEARLKDSMAELHAVSTRLNEAREQERVKMARDIHDHLGQALTALKMDVAEVRRRLDVRRYGARRGAAGGNVGAHRHVCGRRPARRRGASSGGAR